MGFELGGPILKDHAVGLGRGRQDRRRPAHAAEHAGQDPLKDYSFKGTGQFTNDVRGNFTYYRGAKLKYGRNASADPSAGNDLRSGRPDAGLQG